MASKNEPSLSFQVVQPLLLLPKQKPDAVLGLEKVISDSNTRFSSLVIVYSSIRVYLFIRL